MKATELRIGNYVGFKNRTDCYCIIEELSSSGGIHLTRIFNDGDIDDQPEVIEDITGIRLTEEWLMRSGFKTKSNYSNYILNGIEISSMVRVVQTNERRSFWLDGDIPDVWKISLDYVHQLQNLYFALTGEELTIK